MSGTNYSPPLGAAPLGAYLASAVTLTTTNPTNIASITLPPGMWDIKGKLLVAGGASSGGNVDGWIGPTSASVTGAYDSGSVTTNTASMVAGCLQIILFSVQMFVVATTVYLIAQVNIANDGAIRATSLNNSLPNASGLFATPVW